MAKANQGLDVVMNDIVMHVRGKGRSDGVLPKCAYTEIKESDSKVEMSRVPSFVSTGHVNHSEWQTVCSP